jgi:hypothetical protein
MRWVESWKTDTYLVLLDSVCSRILVQGCTAPRLLQVSCRIGLPQSRFCECEIELSLVRTREQGCFCKMAGAWGVPTPCSGVMMQWVLRRACLVRVGRSSVSCWPLISEADYPLELIHPQSELRGSDEEVMCVELPRDRFLCSKARLTQSQNSIFNTVYHFRSRRGHQL